MVICNGMYQYRATALMTAALYGNNECLSMLLANDASVDKADEVSKVTA